MNIAVDFAETLVKERPMIEWVLFELRNEEISLWQKLRFLLNSFTRGPLSIVFGKFQATSRWAAKLAYASFKGLSEKSLENFVNNKLNLNHRLIDVISAIKQRRGIKPQISIHSQGTCSIAIELFTKRSDVSEAISQAGFYISSIVANQMEVKEGKFTGKLIGHIITKHNKHLGIPKGSIFVGDDRDEKAIKKLKDKEFEFINYNNL